jgi:hypothetical protein
LLSERSAQAAGPTISGTADSHALVPSAGLKRYASKESHALSPQLT